MPFYCGNDLLASASYAARNNPQRIPVNTPPVVSSLPPHICQQLLRLATKDYSARLLAHLDLSSSSAYPFRWPKNKCIWVSIFGVLQIAAELDIS